MIVCTTPIYNTVYGVKENPANPALIYSGKTNFSLGKALVRSLGNATAGPVSL